MSTTVSTKAPEKESTLRRWHPAVCPDPVGQDYPGQRHDQ